MSCCAIANCRRGDDEKHEAGMVFVDGRWLCYLCDVLPAMFAPPIACAKPDHQGEPCVLIAGHPSWQQCKSRKTLNGTAKAEDKSTRDGDPKLAAEKVHTEVSRKKTRQGPLYVPHDRRV